MATHNAMLDDTMFKVHEVPIQIEGVKNSDEYKLIVRDDTSEALSCMTRDYRLVSNEEVLEKSLPRIEERGGVLTECKTFGNGARTNWTFQFKNNPVTLYDDELYPQINIRNSYDGSLSVSVLGGVFRLICSNGAIIGKIFEHHSEKHSIWNKKILNGHISDMVENTIDNMEHVFNEEFPVLFNTQVNEKHIVKVIERMPSLYNESAVNYFMAHNPKTYWDLFNMCTWVFTHVANREHESTHKAETDIYHYIRNLAGKA